MLYLWHRNNYNTLKVNTSTTELPSTTSSWRILSNKSRSSQSHIATDGQSICNLVSSPIWGSWPYVYYSSTVTVLFFFLGRSLTRGRVCLLYMLLALASIVFLGSEFLGTRDHILLSQIWDFPFRRLLRLAGSRWRYSNPPLHGCPVEAEAEAEAYCRQPAGTLNPGTGPRWDPWPYICSMSRPLLCFVFPFVDPPYWQGGVGVFCRTEQSSLLLI
jgi:hypothetical protein